MDILNVLFAFAIGASVGKFMALISHYLPKMLLRACSQPKEPSHLFKWLFRKPFCWHCNRPLPWLAYFSIHRKCPHCRHSIPLKALIVEILTALLFGISFLLFGFSATLIFVLTVSCLLICCFLTDYGYGILPDQLTITLVWVGLIGSLYPILISSQDAILGAVAGYGILWAFNLIYRAFRKFDGIYPGDFKLNAGIGACVGLKWLIPILILSLALLIAASLVKFLFNHKSLNKKYLYSEMPYACPTSTVALGALYLGLLA